MPERQVLVLVDGEHHPDAVRAALDELAAHGDEPALVLYLGGSEKVEVAGQAPELGWPVRWPDDPLAELPRLLAETDVDAVVDRTAHPVVDDRRRHLLVAVTLAAGRPYEAPGVRWEPLDRTLRTGHPTMAVVATGKRTGKTAIAGALARHAAGRAWRPVVLAMGRGGPPEPVVIPAGRDLSTDHLRAVATAGGHAASDFYEDAMMTGVATVGCRRVGEGPAGQVGTSNLADGVAAARQLDVDLAILDGSGAAIPPCHADATALVVPASVHPGVLHAMLPLRLLLADLVIVSLADPRLVEPGQVETVLEALRALTADLPGGDGAPWPPLGMVISRFRPTPLQDVSGARLLVATTAPPAVGPILRADLAALGAEVVAVTHALADRAQLRADLEAAPAYDVLLTELKAAAVDVAAAAAQQRGATTVFYDNRPEALPARGAGPGVHADLGPALDALLTTAVERHAGRDVHEEAR